MRWLPFIGWRDIPAQEAAEIGLEQAGRHQWQLLCFEWFGFGFCIAARPRHAV